VLKLAEGDAVSSFSPTEKEHCSKLIVAVSATAVKELFNIKSGIKFTN